MLVSEGPWNSGSVPVAMFMFRPGANRSEEPRVHMPALACLNVSCAGHNDVLDGPKQRLWLRLVIFSQWADCAWPRKNPDFPPSAEVLGHGSPDCPTGALSALAWVRMRSLYSVLVVPRKSAVCGVHLCTEYTPYSVLDF